jgi:hypothetical protein
MSVVFAMPLLIVSLAAGTSLVCLLTVLPESLHLNKSKMLVIFHLSKPGLQLSTRPLILCCMLIHMTPMPKKLPMTCVNLRHSSTLAMISLRTLVPLITLRPWTSRMHLLPSTTSPPLTFLSPLLMMLMMMTMLMMPTHAPRFPSWFPVLLMMMMTRCCLRCFPGLTYALTSLFAACFNVPLIFTTIAFLLLFLRPTLLSLTPPRPRFSMHLSLEFRLPMFPLRRSSLRIEAVVPFE